jgi:tetratricopeptide (TPR) repeat protein
VALSGASGAELAVPLAPALSSETAAVLENLLPFYDRLAVDGSGNEQLRVEAAKATRRTGDIRAHLGQADKARAAYGLALVLFEKLAADAPAAKYETEIAGIHNALGIIARNGGNIVDAQKEHREARTILEPLATQPNAAAFVRFQLARTYFNLGVVIRGGITPIGVDGPAALTGQPDGPPSGPMRGLPPLGSGPPGPGGPAPLGQSPRDLGPAWDDPSNRVPLAERPPPGPPLEQLDPHGAWDSVPPAPSPLMEEGRPAVSLSNRGEGASDFANSEDEYLRKAVALLKQLTTEQPENPDYQHLLACCYRDLARSPYAKANDPRFQQAITILEKLVKQHPESPAYRFDLISSYARLGRNEPLGREKDDAIEQDLQRALKLADELVAQYPAVPTYAALQAPLLQKLAQLQRRSGRMFEADQTLRRAIDLQTNLLQRFPNNSVYSQWLEQLRRELPGGPPP